MKRTIGLTEWIACSGLRMGLRRRAGQKSEQKCRYKDLPDARVASDLLVDERLVMNAANSSVQSWNLDYVKNLNRKGLRNVEKRIK